MPSPWHDAVKQLFHDQPELAAQILRECAGLADDIPGGLPARLEPASFNDRPSTDFDADTVVVDGPARDPVHGTIVEAQQSMNAAKLQQLPRYAAALWLLLRRRVDVLMICPEDQIAAWYAKVIPTSLPGYTFRPVVIGPAQVPAIIDPLEVAASPGLGALSVAMHGQDQGVAKAFVDGLAFMTAKDGPTYYENAYSMSVTAIRELLEELVSSTTWPVYSPFAKEHFGRGKAEGKAEGIAEGKAEGIAEGKAEGESEAVLLVLRARGLHVSTDDHRRITTCTDTKQLKTWITRAATISATNQLFES
jgi:hypothetical protein